MEGLLSAQPVVAAVKITEETVLLGVVVAEMELNDVAATVTASPRA